MIDTLFHTDCVQYEVSGEENIPPGHFVLAPNHPVTLDRFKVLCSNQFEPGYYSLFVRKVLSDRNILPRLIVAQPPEEALQEYLKSLHCFGLEKSESGVLEDSSRAQLNAWLQIQLKAKEQCCICLYPEAHSHGAGKFGPLNKGALWIARSFGIPLVPARLDGFDSPAGAELRSVSVQFGTPITINKDQQFSEEYIQGIRQQAYCDELGLQLVDRQ